MRTFQCRRSLSAQRVLENTMVYRVCSCSSEGSTTTGSCVCVLLCDWSHCSWGVCVGRQQEKPSDISDFLLSVNAPQPNPEFSVVAQRNKRSTDITHAPPPSSSSSSSSSNWIHHCQNLKTTNWLLLFVCFVNKSHEKTKNNNCWCLFTF